MWQYQLVLALRRGSESGVLLMVDDRIGCRNTRLVNTQNKSVHIAHAFTSTNACVLLMNNLYQEYRQYGEVGVHSLYYRTSYVGSLQNVQFLNRISFHFGLHVNSLEIKRELRTTKTYGQECVKEQTTGSDVSCAQNVK